MDYAFRAIVLLDVLLLLILYVIISAARKRQDRVEHKIDLLGERLGLAEKFADLDVGTGRKSAFAPLHDFPDSTP